MLEAYLEALDLGFYEVQFALEGLADENVWKRPAENILSVGELAGHVAYWEAVRFSGEGGERHEPDLSKRAVQSPLIDIRFAYLPMNLPHPPTEQQRAMTAEQVYRELLRVHQETMAYFKTWNPDLDSAPSGYEPEETFRKWLQYAAFHIAYHTGQMYTVRHLLGETTPDN